MSKNIINKKIEDISTRNLRVYKEPFWYGEQFLEEFLGIKEKIGLNILEIGTAEAGLLNFFSEKGHNCNGIEYSGSRFENSILLNENLNLKLYQRDVCDFHTMEHLSDIKFDIIIIRDVIEHVVDKLKALENIQKLFSKEGKVFISFPPKYSPFTGHQQVLPRRIVKLPYLFLLSNSLYRLYVKIVGVQEAIINGLLDIKAKLISLREFNKLLLMKNYSLIQKDFYFVRPCHEFRYKLKRIKNIFSNIFTLNEIFTLGALFKLSKKNL